MTILDSLKVVTQKIKEYIDAGLSNRYTKEESDEKYLTDHQDVSMFITKAVSDLENYYTKSLSYTREEINQLISAIPKFKFQPVDVLPTSDVSTTTVYLLRLQEEEQGNLYAEYIYVDNKWEILGKQILDLSGYALKEDIPDEVTENEVAGWGFTKNTGNYNKPETGIPETDLSEDVKEKLNDTQIELDTTLKQAGKAADAKSVGDVMENMVSLKPGREVEFVEKYELDAVTSSYRTLNENKISKPTDAPAVGKVLKVKSVNADGTFVCEWADDANDGAVKDVQVNGASVLDADGVAKVPIGNEKWELITDLTLSEDSTMVTIDKDKDGKPFLLKELYFEQFVKASNKNGARCGLMLNGKSIYLSPNNAMMSASDTYSKGYARRLGDGYGLYNISVGVSNSSAYDDVLVYMTRNSFTYEPISSYNWYQLNQGTLKEGSTLKVWGIRA